MKTTNPLAKLFGRSPFTPIQDHMRTVAECVGHLPELFAALQDGDQDRVREIAKAVDAMESRADEKKHDFRFHMPSTLWMPVARRDLLLLISEQDGISDSAEDIAKLLTQRDVEVPGAIKDLLNELVQTAIDTFNHSAQIIEELDELLEVGFGGKESAKVIDMIKELRHAEHKNDTIIEKIKRALYEVEGELDAVSVMFLYKLIDYVGRIANRSENVGDRVLLLIAK